MKTYNAADNCVGFRNQGHFIRFLVFAILSCSICLVLICVRVYEIFYHFDDILDGNAKITEQEVCVDVHFQKVSIRPLSSLELSVHRFCLRE